MKTVEILNAVIKSVKWDRERGLTQWIMVEGDGWGCGFGGYHLGGEACYEWIIALMDALDIYEFDDKALVGKVIRVKSEGLGGGIIALGHPIKDKWICPKELFAKYNKQQ